MAVNKVLRRFDRSCFSALRNFSHYSAAKRNPSKEDTKPEIWLDKKDNQNFIGIDDADEDDDSTVFIPSAKKHSTLYYKDLCRKLSEEGKVCTTT